MPCPVPLSWGIPVPTWQGTLQGIPRTPENYLIVRTVTAPGIVQFYGAHKIESLLCRVPFRAIYEHTSGKVR